MQGVSKPWRNFDGGAFGLVGAYHGGNAHFFVTTMFIKPLKQIICVDHLLRLPNTLTLPFEDQIFFSTIMFVTLVVDNVVTLVVVTLVGDKIVTLVVDSQNLCPSCRFMM